MGFWSILMLWRQVVVLKEHGSGDVPQVSSACPVLWGQPMDLEQPTSIDAEKYLAMCQWNLVSALELSCYQLLTLDTTYSLSLTSCSSPTLPSCIPYSCIHCFAVLSFTLLLPPTLALSTLLILLINAMFLDLIYRTFLHVIICHVRISTLILISLSTWPHTEPLNPWTLVSGLPEIIFVIYRTLALFVTSMLTCWTMLSSRLTPETSGHPQNLWYAPEILGHE